MGTVSSVDQQRKSRNAQLDSQRVQRAGNAAQAAEERRRLVREERVKRARILQASENSGVAGGSGEAGATSSLGTNLSSNLNFNSGAIDRGEQLSIFQQNSIVAQSKSALYSTLGNTASSIFSAAGGIAKSPSSGSDNAFQRYTTGNLGSGDGP